MSEYSYFNVSRKEEENKYLSYQFLGDDRFVYQRAMQLYLNMFSLIGESSLKKNEQIVNLMLYSRIFNHLETAWQLLLFGYYVESVIIIRSMVETIWLTEYIIKFPEKANDWLAGKQIKPGIVRNSLENKKERAEIYDILCHFAAHPTLDSIDADYEDARLVLKWGAIFDKEKFRKVYSLLMTQFLEMLSLVYHFYYESFEGNIGIEENYKIISGKLRQIVKELAN
ncbi:MAG: hypothetical protein HY776_04645 [Actinobacteria bacterium]|nr:hypothetical protein [Actinomycetota bacterium]